MNISVRQYKCKIKYYFKMLVSMKTCLTLSCCVTSKISSIIKRKGKQLVGPPINNYLDPYESAIGFCNSSRIGSRNFNSVFGTLLEEIYDTSELFNKFNKKENNFHCDGYSDDTLFESKSRFNTMKSSFAVHEIESKLMNSIKQDKKFVLLVLNDNPNKYPNGQKIPLHLGFNMKQIELYEGYNPNIHLWISGFEIYKYLWPENPTEIKNTIINELYTLSCRL
jgi:hypothetical protein